MPSKVKPLTNAQLKTFESKRDLAGELLESVRQMKAGKTQVVLSPAGAFGHASWFRHTNHKGSPGISAACLSVLRRISES